MISTGVVALSLREMHLARWFDGATPCNEDTVSATVTNIAVQVEGPRLHQGDRCARMRMPPRRAARRHGQMLHDNVGSQFGRYGARWAMVACPTSWRVTPCDGVASGDWTVDRGAREWTSLERP